MASRYSRRHWREGAAAAALSMLMPWTSAPLRRPDQPDLDRDRARHRICGHPRPEKRLAMGSRLVARSCVTRLENAQDR
jgi:hypothetical protein